MLEEERRKRLKTIEKSRKEMRTLKEKKRLFYNLKKEVLIKLYLRLEAELDRKEILTVEEIKRREMGRPPEAGKCNHDIWYYRGTESDYSIYDCLDCYEEIHVSSLENSEFLKMHTVIKTDVSFQKCRNLYIHLLCTNHVDTAYEKLLKKIKKFEEKIGE